MPWVVTLRVEDCANNAKIVGAFITDGVNTEYTDSYGQYIIVVNDAFHTYVVNIGKSGYVTKNFAFNRGTMEGKTVTECLDKKIPPPPDDDDGGW